MQISTHKKVDFAPSDTHTHIRSLSLTHAHTPHPHLCHPLTNHISSLLEKQTPLWPFTLFSNELCDVQAIMNYSIHARCLFNPSCFSSSREEGLCDGQLATLQTFGLLCSTFPAVVAHMWSDQLRGGGWKDWILLFIVPYRQGSVGWEMEIHCVVSPCLRHE